MKVISYICTQKHSEMILCNWPAPSWRAVARRNAGTRSRFLAVHVVKVTRWRYQPDHLFWLCGKRGRRTNKCGCVPRFKGCLGLLSVQGCSRWSFVQIILILSCLVHCKSFYGDTVFPSPTFCHPTSSIFMITCLSLMCFTCVLSYLSSPPDIQPPRFLLPVPGHLVLFHSRIPDLASLLRLVSTVCVSFCAFLVFSFGWITGEMIPRCGYRSATQC